MPTKGAEWIQDVSTSVLSATVLTVITKIGNDQQLGDEDKEHLRSAVTFLDSAIREKQQLDTHDFSESSGFSHYGSALDASKQLQDFFAAQQVRRMDQVLKRTLDYIECVLNPTETHETAKDEIDWLRTFFASLSRVSLSRIGSPLEGTAHIASGPLLQDT